MTLRPPLNLQDRVDRRLGRLLPPAGTHPALLHDAMQHILLAPGKRLRPLLALAVAEQLGGDPLLALDPGCALEMVYAASLIIDDLPCMDDARIRKVRAATHVAYGEDVAVLAAVSLLTRAVAVVGASSAASLEARLDAVALVTHAIGSLGLCGGQFDDLRPDPTGNAAQLEDVQHRKSGMLFAVAAEIGGLVIGAEAGTLAHLRRFGAHVGRAYQLLDDMLDGNAPSEVPSPGLVFEEEGGGGACGADPSRGISPLRWHLDTSLAAAAAIGAGTGGPLRRFLATTFGRFAGL